MRPYWTLNLFGVFLNRDPKTVEPEIVNHELIHTAQMRELLWIPFYIIYGLEWLWHFLCTLNVGKAYRRVSFECEAYDNDGNPDYLKDRRHYAQWKGRP